MVSYIRLVHNNKHRHSFNGLQINLFLPHILQGKNINFVSLLSSIFSHKTFSLITFFPLQRLTTGNFILFCLSLKDISLEYLIRTTDWSIVLFLYTKSFNMKLMLSQIRFWNGFLISDKAQIKYKMEFYDSGVDTVLSG